MTTGNLPSEQWDTIQRYVGEFPVKISALAKELGLSIKLATLDPGISGEIRPDQKAPSGYKIRINRHESKNRQRFTAAHEVAHYLLHRNLIGDGLSDTVLYRSRLSNKIEAQANGFAANLLMPRDLIEQQLREHVDIDEDQLVNVLAEKFEVSPAAMKIRLGVES